MVQQLVYAAVLITQAGCTVPQHQSPTSKRQQHTHDVAPAAHAAVHPRRIFGVQGSRYCNRHCNALVSNVLQHRMGQHIKKKEAPSTVDGQTCYCLP